MVELAMTLPILLLLVFALIDFSLIFQSYFAARNAARVGARVASSFHPDCDTGDLANEVTAVVNTVMEAASIPSDATAEIEFPLDASRLCGGDPGGLVAVEVHFPHRLRLLGNLLAGTGFPADVTVSATDLQRDFN